MAANQIRLRGHLVEEDENGRWNLNDIWMLAKAPETRLPKHWKVQKAVKRLVDELQKKVTVAYLGKIKTKYSSYLLQEGSRETTGHSLIPSLLQRMQGI